MNKYFTSNLDEFSNLLKKINWKIVSFDSETDSLNWYEQKCIGFSLCDGSIACYVDLSRKHEATKLKFFDKLDTWMSVELKWAVFHNAPFDLALFYKYGVIAEDFKLFDSQVASHILNENWNNSLKRLAVNILGIPQNEVIEYKQAITNGFSSRRFYNYAINDAIWTFQLAEHFAPAIKEHNFQHLFYHIEMPFQWVLRDLRINGIAVDINEINALKKPLNDKLFALEKELLETVNLPYAFQYHLFDDNKEIVSNWNLNSNPQISKILFDKLGLEPIEYTKGGVPSVGKFTLYHYLDIPFVKKLIEYRAFSKLHNTYVETIPKYIDPDGRVRPDFRDTKPVTGRLSCANPNLQNTPRRSEVTDVNYRNVFVAEEGKKLICADYSGQELRGLADVTEDYNLITAFKANQDLHLKTANAILNLGLTERQLITTEPGYEDIKKKYKEERHKGKNGANFPIIYGATPLGVARNIGITEREAKKYMAIFFKLYPAVGKKIKEVEYQVRKYKFVVNKAGRRRRFITDEIKPRQLRQAFNFLIQGIGADQLRLAMVNLRKWFLDNPQWDTKLVLTVHDEIVIEINKEFAEEAAPQIKMVMENSVPWESKVGYPVDIRIVDKYGN